MRTYMDDIPPGITFSMSLRPSFVMKHIDGPMIVFRDGQMHWLTFGERFLVWIGCATPESIERKRRPNLVKYLAARSALTGAPPP
jgi:hypothetical protein